MFSSLHGPFPSERYTLVVMIFQVGDFARRIGPLSKTCWSGTSLMQFMYVYQRLSLIIILK